MDFAERIALWAEAQRAVSGLTLIGSQMRAADDVVWQADAQSDWDFQIITRDIARFTEPGWLREAGFAPDVYAVRRAAIGGVPKIVVLLPGIEADFVLIPTGRLRMLKLLVRAGWHRRSAAFRRTLGDLAIVIRPGWRFLKGAGTWEPFYRQVVAEVADPRLDDATARALADSFVCDYVWTVRKLNRGEWLAAQRMIHRSLVETNLRLRHELRLRRKERTFPEGRRAEFILPAHELAQLTVATGVDAWLLQAAMRKSAATLCELMRELQGDAWRWPERIPIQS